MGVSDPVSDGHSTFPIQKPEAPEESIGGSKPGLWRPVRDHYLLSLGSIEANTVVQNLPQESTEVTVHKLNDKSHLKRSKSGRVSNFLKLWGSGVTGWLLTFSNIGVYFSKKVALVSSAAGVWFLPHAF